MSNKLVANLTSYYAFELEPAQAARLPALLESHFGAKPEGVLERGVRIDPGIADRLRATGYLR